LALQETAVKVWAKFSWLRSATGSWLVWPNL